MRELMKKALKSVLPKPALPAPVKETPVYFAPVSDDLAVRLAYAIHVQRPPLAADVRALFQEAHDEIVRIREDRDKLGADYALRQAFVTRVITEMFGMQVESKGGAIQSSDVDRKMKAILAMLDEKRKAR
jgi:hypothetical protein